MDNWFCSVFNVVFRKRLSSPRCRSELIDSAWVVIFPGHKCIKTCTLNKIEGKHPYLSLLIYDFNAKNTKWWGNVNNNLGVLLDEISTDTF